MKRNSIVALALSLILIVSGCSGNEASDEIPIMKSESSYAVYQSFEELMNNATDIVEVEVLMGQETFVENDVPSTISNVKILSVLKGDLSKSDIIPIVETGGVFYPELYGDKKYGKQKNPVELAVEGVRVMQPGDHQIIFLKPYEDGIFAGSYYILGLYQGKFKIEKEKVTRGGPAFVNTKDFKFESVNELKEEVEKAKKSK